MNYFTTEIYLKPYVAHFLKNIYGDPIKLSKNKELHRHLITSLKEGYPEDTTKEPKKLNTLVKIKLSEYEFYRYGWEISLINTLRFNNMVEHTIKKFVYSWVGTYKAFGLPVTKAIKNFQKVFNFPDEIYPFDTIRRDEFRNGIKFDENLVDEIILTIHKKLIKSYEVFVPGLGRQIFKQLNDEYIESVGKTLQKNLN